MSPRAAWRLETLGFQTVYEYAAGIADWAAAGLPVEGSLTETPTIGQVARKDVPTAHLEDQLRDVTAQAQDAGWDTVMVVNDRGVLLGRLFKTQLNSGTKANVESVMKPGPSTFRPNVSVPEMVEYMNRHDLRTAPVTTSEGVLSGVVFKEDLDRIVQEMHEAHSH